MAIHSQWHPPSILTSPETRHRRFWTSRTVYVRFTLTNRSAHDFQLNSAYSLFQTCEILTRWPDHFSSIQNYGAAVSVFLDTEVSSETRARYLSLLVGTTSGNGITICRRTKPHPVHGLGFDTTLQFVKSTFRFLDARIYELDSPLPTRLVHCNKQAG